MIGFLRIFLALIFIAAIVLFVANDPGTVHIVWHGYVVDLPAALAILIVAACVWILIAIIGIRGVLRRFWDRRIVRREFVLLQKNISTLGQGVLAIASGDNKKASKLLHSVRDVPSLAPLIGWLSRDLVIRYEDSAALQDLGIRLANNPDTEPMAARLLLEKAQQNNSSADVDILLARFGHLTAKMPWLSLARLDKAARKNAFKEAINELAKAEANGLMPPGVSKKTRAVLVLALAQTFIEQGKYARALRFANEAANLVPSWVSPHIISVKAQLLLPWWRLFWRSKMRRLRRAWRRAPHPDLLPIMRKTWPHDKPLAALRRLEYVTQDVSDHSTVHRVLAAAFVDAGIWGQAKRHLLALVGRGEATVADFRLLANIARNDALDDEAAILWLDKSSSAPQDEAWVCESCGKSHDAWDAICKGCERLGTILWQRKRANSPSAHTAY